LVIIRTTEPLTWTIQDGLNWKTFLEGPTGVKLVSLLQDRLIKSAYECPEDVMTFRQGLMDMYNYLLSRRAEVTPEQYAKILQQQQKDRGSTVANVQKDADPRPAPGVNKPVTATGG
jgi:hypothetical protein